MIGSSTFGGPANKPNDKRRRQKLEEKRKRRQQRQDKRERSHAASRQDGLPLEAALSAIAYLEQDGYSTEGLKRLKADLAVPAGGLAGSLLAGYLTLAPRLAPSPTETWRFAGALAFLAGPAEARKAIRSMWLREDVEAPQLVMAMAAALEGDRPDDWPSLDAMRPVIRRGLGDVVEAAGHGEEGMHELAYGLFTVPAALRPAMLEALLEGVPDAGDRATLAAIALLSPLDPASYEASARTLAESVAGRAMLSDLPSEGVPAEAFAAARRALMRSGETAGRGRKPTVKGAPLGWPVEEAWATWSDGRGSMAVYLVRKRPGKKRALFGCVMNDQRGVVDVIAVPDMTEAELDDFLAQAETANEGRLAEVDTPFAIARIEAAEAATRAQSYPLPIEFLADRYLLAGLTAEGAPDLGAIARRRAKTSLLAYTPALLHTVACDSWHFVDDGTEGAGAFFEEAEAFFSQLGKGRKPTPKLPTFPKGIDEEIDAPYALELSAARAKELEAIARRHAGELFPAPVRERWRDRLLVAMALFDADDRPHMADLAGTAAWAVAPDSPIPLADQPLWPAMLMRSAFAGSALGHRVPLAEPPAPEAVHSAKVSETFVAFADPLLQALPDGAPLAAYQAVLELARAIWNAQLPGKSDRLDLRTPFTRLVETLKLTPGIDLAAIAEATQALLERKTAFFEHDHREIQMVSARYEGQQVRVKVGAIGPLPTQGSGR